MRMRIQGKNLGKGRFCGRQPPLSVMASTRPMESPGKVGEDRPAACSTASKPAVVYGSSYSPLAQLVITNSARQARVPQTCISTVPVHPTHPARSCIRRRSPTRLTPAWHRTRSHRLALTPVLCITTRTLAANQRILVPHLPRVHPLAHHFVGVQGVPSHRTSLPKGQANHPGSLRARRGPRRVAVPAS